MKLSFHRKLLSGVITLCIVTGVFAIIPLTVSAASLFDYLGTDRFAQPGDFLSVNEARESSVYSITLSDRDNNPYASVEVHNLESNPNVETLDVLLYGDYWRLGHAGAVITVDNGSVYSGKAVNYSDGTHISFDIGDTITGRYELYISLRKDAATLPSCIAVLNNGSGGIVSGWGEESRIYEKVSNAGENNVLSLVTASNGIFKIKGEPTSNLPIVTLQPKAATDTIAAGYEYSMFIKSDGTLWATGSNNYGQIGNGKGKDDFFVSGTGWVRTMELKPVQIMSGVKSIYSSGSASYAIKDDNSLWAWGDGQIGDGTESAKLSPVKIMDDVLSINASESSYVFAIKTDNSLWAWGRNENGELGDGTTTNRLTPVKIMDNVYSIVQSHDGHITNGKTNLTVYVIKTDGSLWAWGSNYMGQIGNGTRNSSYDEYVPCTKITDNVIAVSADNGHAVAIKSDGSLWTWGHSWEEREGYDSGGLQNGVWPYYSAASPVKMTDGVKSVYSAPHLDFYIKNDNSLRSWGDPDNDASAVLLDNVASVIPDITSFFAIKTDGSFWGWGDNGYGNLGYGESGDDITSPVKVMDSVADAKAGMHSLILKKDGTLWGMGSDLRGALGQGSVIWSRPEPVKISDGVKLPGSTATITSVAS